MRRTAEAIAMSEDDTEQIAFWRYEEAEANCNRHGCDYTDSGPLHSLRERVDEHVREQEHCVTLQRGVDDE